VTMWRDFLTTDEQSEIATLDRRIIDARAADHEATRIREAIRRRATGRMRRGVMPKGKE
jgi:hypothetical protein